MNAIAKCPITMKDKDVSENIFRPYVSSLKFKSTRTKPNPVHIDEIEIPK